jgi:hypothetical protein
MLEADKNVFGFDIQVHHIKLLMEIDKEVQRLIYSIFEFLRILHHIKCLILIL